MAVGDYAIACPGMHGKAARKIWAQSLQEPDTTKHTSGQKLVLRRVTIQTTLV